MKKNSPLQKIALFLVKTRFIWAAVFAVLIVVSAVMMQKTNISYDLSDYAPKSGLSGQSIEILKEEFDDTGSLTILFENLEGVQQAEQRADDIRNIAGIKSVIFDKQTGFKGGKALFTVTLSDYDSSEGANDTVKAVLKYTKDNDGYISGQSAETFYTRRAVEKGIMTAGIIIAVVIVAMLTLTSRTFFEVAIMLIVFGAAALINMGSNYLFDKISYLSNYVGLILQLVLAIDYSIILLHRYLEELENNPPKQAMSNSLTKGIPEILSSSLTTISGMCALMLMTLPIGFELGFVLAKGIALSLVTVILLMPSLLILFSKLIIKTKHRAFLPPFRKPVANTLKLKNFIAPLFAVLVAVSFFGQSQNVFAFNMTQTKNIKTAKAAIREEFGELNSLVVLVPKGDYEQEKALTELVLSKESINRADGFATIEITDGVYLGDKINAQGFAYFAAGLGGLSFEMAQIIANSIFQDYALSKGETPSESYEIVIADLLNFMSLNNEYAPFIPTELGKAKKMFEGENYSRIIFNINGAVEGDETFNLIEELNIELESFYGGGVLLAGESVVNLDMSKAFYKDNVSVVIFTALFIFIILLATFRNFLQSLIMLLTIQGSVWMNFAVSYLIGFPISFIGYLMITAIQMGATIDYAIILTSRFRQEKAKGGDLKANMTEAVSSAFPTIITSGGILALAGFILRLSTLGEPVISSLGLLLGIGTLFSMATVLFVLPSLLVVLNKPIEKTEITFKSKNK